MSLWNFVLIEPRRKELWETGTDFVFPWTELPETKLNIFGRYPDPGLYEFTSSNLAMH